MPITVETPVVVCGIVSALGIQGWILREIIDIKVRLAVLTNTQDQMKNQIKSAVLALLIIAPLFFAGCVTNPNTGKRSFQWDALLAKPQAGAITTNFVTQTNIVLTAENRFETNYVTQTVLHTNIVYVPGVIDSVAKAGETIRPFVPPPYDSALSIVSTGLTVLAAWVVKRKNAQLAKTETMLDATISGIEKASKVLPEGKQVKNTVEAMAEKSGVAIDLYRKVKALTS